MWEPQWAADSADSADCFSVKNKLLCHPFSMAKQQTLGWHSQSSCPTTGRCSLSCSSTATNKQQTKRKNKTRKKLSWVKAEKKYKQKPLAHKLSPCFCLCIPPLVRAWGESQKCWFESWFFLNLSIYFSHVWAANYTQSFIWIQQFQFLSKNLTLLRLQGSKHLETCEAQWYSSGPIRIQLSPFWFTCKSNCWQ